jgi:hypothetical protein
LSKEKWTKTIINKDEPRKSDENMTEQEKADRYVSRIDSEVFLPRSHTTSNSNLIVEKIHTRKSSKNQALWHAETL